MFDDDDYDDSAARKTDPLTSHEAPNDPKLRARISDAILQVALEAGAAGVTINECAEKLSDYKAWSISPMFKPLVRRGLLVRRVLGVTEPTRRWPDGKEIFETRVDPITHKRCIVNYHHTVLKKPAATAPAQQRLEYGS